MADFVVITGMGGAGRTQVAHTLEDLGWFVIDNLPVELLTKVVELAQAPGSTYEKVALVAGSIAQPAELLSQLRSLAQSVDRLRVVYLYASADALVNRYESTRRVHPAAIDGRGIVEAVAHERIAMEPIAAGADISIDTTSLSVHDLARRVRDLFADVGHAHTRVSIMSFAYSKGVPRDADIVIDCRYLPNPHWLADLRPLNGRDQAVSEYLEAQPIMAAARERLLSWLLTVMPAYAAESRAYLTIAFGCTGGKHRSVAMAESVAAALSADDFTISVTHRERNSW